MCFPLQLNKRAFSSSNELISTYSLQPLQQLETADPVKFVSALKPAHYKCPVAMALYMHVEVGITVWVIQLQLLKYGIWSEMQTWRKKKMHFFTLCSFKLTLLGHQHFKNTKVILDITCLHYYRFYSESLFFTYLLIGA